MPIGLIDLTALLNFLLNDTAEDTMRLANQDEGIVGRLASVLTGGTVPASEVFASYMDERDAYLLDPLSAARQLGSSQPYLRTLMDLTAQEQESLMRKVDAGSVEIDRMLRGFGLTTNMAGVRKPVFTYPLAEDAHLKRNYVPVKTKGADGKGTMVEFINLTHTPMMDWDTPGPHHNDANVTMRHLGDIEDATRAYVDKHPESELRIYRSPGGFRAWEMSDQMGVQDFAPRAEELKVDPDYARISLDGANKTVGDTGIQVDPPGFRSRISHKPGRVDWVAQPLMTISGTEAMEDPRARQLIQVLHDDPIKRGYLDSDGMSPDAIKLIEAELPTASRALQQELRRRFRI